MSSRCPWRQWHPWRHKWWDCWNKKEGMRSQWIYDSSHLRAINEKKNIKKNLGEKAFLSFVWYNLEGDVKCILHQLSEGGFESLTESPDKSVLPCTLVFLNTSFEIFAKEKWLSSNIYIPSQELIWKSDIISHSSHKFKNNRPKIINCPRHTVSAPSVSVGRSRTALYTFRASNSSA